MWVGMLLPTKVVPFSSVFAFSPLLPPGQERLPSPWRRGEELHALLSSLPLSVFGNQALSLCLWSFIGHDTQGGGGCGDQMLHFTGWASLTNSRIQY